MDQEDEERDRDGVTVGRGRFGSLSGSSRPALLGDDTEYRGADPAASAAVGEDGRAFGVAK